MLSLGQWRIAVSAYFRSFPTNTTSSSNGVLSIPSISRNYRSNRSRGGQNLSERYRRLENTLRGRNVPVRQRSEISQDVEDASKARSPPLSSSSSYSAQNTPDTIAGLVIPEEPIPPSDEECCMSGCAICVYDLYEESLEAYKESIAALRSSLSALTIPDSEWPDRIRTNTPAAEKRHAVRQLKEKKERRAAVEAES
ncbi:oxidoreductase-like protein [Suillus occidentalis]|nr:oxidoreductase-like protein [Suillus occidentalis]